MKKGTTMKWIAASAFLWIAPLSTAAHASNILCTVIAEGASGKVLRQQGACDQRITAASTFQLATMSAGRSQQQPRDRKSSHYLRRPPPG